MIQLLNKEGDNDFYLRDSAKNFYNVFSEGIHQFHEEIKLFSYSNSSINISLKRVFTFLFLKILYQENK